MVLLPVPGAETGERIRLPALEGAGFRVSVLAMRTPGEPQGLGRGPHTARPRTGSHSDPSPASGHGQEPLAGQITTVIG